MYAVCFHKNVAVVFSHISNSQTPYPINYKLYINIRIFFMMYRLKIEYKSNN